MKNVTNVRNNLKVKTIFNILDPFINPASADMQLIGVYDKNLLQPIAECLKKLGIKKAWVVCGENGVDEITLSGKTYNRIKKKSIKSNFIIDPEKIGMKKHSLNKIKGKIQNIILKKLVIYLIIKTIILFIKILFY